MRVPNFGQNFGIKMSLRLISGSTYTRVYTVTIKNHLLLQANKFLLKSAFLGRIWIYIEPLWILKQVQIGNTESRNEKRKKSCSFKRDKLQSATCLLSKFSRFKFEWKKGKEWLFRTLSFTRLALSGSLVNDSNKHQSLMLSTRKTDGHTDIQTKEKRKKERMKERNAFRW
jgi:hypothetical protein